MRERALELHRKRIFSWNDPQPYAWVIRGSASKHSILRVIGPVLGIVLAVLVTYGVAALLHEILYLCFWIVLRLIGTEWPVATARPTSMFEFSCTLLFTVGPFLLFVYLFWLGWRGNHKQKIQADSLVDGLLLMSLGMIAWAMKNLASSGFSGNVESLLEWLRFWAYHVLRAITLDIPEIFHVHWSTIETQTWFAQLITVFFRFVVTAGAFKFLWMVYRRRFKEEIVSGTVRECFWRCQSLLDSDSLDLQRTGKVDFFPEPEDSVKVLDFLQVLQEGRSSAETRGIWR